MRALSEMKEFYRCANFQMHSEQIEKLAYRL
jgi:hypothetical protein